MRIVGAHLGQAIRYPESHGDLWTTTWAADDALYSVSDDTFGFDRACNSNLALHRVTGKMPPDIRGVTINSMSEYGHLAQHLEDGAMWKACGLICLDGVLYLTVSRHSEPGPPFFVQETWDASIVKSEDYGRTWSATPQLWQAMFPGHTFGSPFFVQYGRDGRGGVDEFIYAVSSNGVWNNGSAMTLGRVRRDRIASLDPADWEFAHGFNEQVQPIWRPRHDTARYIFRAPGRTSMTGIHYITPLGLYIMPQWHFTALDDPDRRWNTSRLEFYQAAAPWGPWTRFHMQEFRPEGWYNPCIVSKFISTDGRRLWLFAAGDWTTHSSRPFESYYGLYMMEMTLEVEE